ncbi:hypothetical protein [Amycolatopsis suaedae]|uniref:Peptidase M41 domain-containing protein n=1 Tax=Amycolatopsis suaedae TaxID=2510978 RepID=A0A4Q7J4E2_9PSEU|nr:hypothetical protein [Amycolatopsis suaedae]RZQ60864.1 hypothetical protein EWH70_27585 [Amycolatopsis suaedae]
MSRLDDLSPHELGRYALAAHEAGHGVVHKALGDKVAWVRLGSGGGCTRTRVQTLDHDVIGSLAGQEAQALWISRRLGWSFGSALSLARKSSGHDLAHVRKVIGRSGLSLGAAQSRARSLVRSNWGRIDRAATRLYRSGQLSGWDL